ncbi:MAG: hypothetical protein KTR30_25515 [Saprospiraceae bacterium]|nr:hypothetical protein [Saprospiraceae bacterium]
MEPLQTKDWDRDKVWLQIEKGLQKKRRKRAVWFWWLGTVSLGLLTFCTYLYFNHHTNSTLGQFPIQWAGTSIEQRLPVDTRPGPSAEIADLPSASGEHRGSADAQVTPQFPTQTGIKLQNKHLTMTEVDSSHFSRPAPTLLKASGPQLAAQEISSTKDVAGMPILSPLDLIAPSISNPLRPLLLGANGPIVPPPVASPWKVGFNSTWSRGKARHYGPDTWIDAKEMSESFNFAATHSLLLEKSLDDHWHAYLGIQHQLLFNTYDFTTESLRIQTVPNDSAVVYQLDGLDAIYEPGTLEETTTNRRWIIRNNKQERWSIPFGLGYRYEKGRLGFQATLGLNFQFWQGFRGVALDEVSRTHVLNQSEISGKYYRNPWQFNFNTSFDFSYPLHPRYTLLLGLNYQQDNLISVRQQAYRSTYQLWGLSIGMRMPISIGQPSQ